MEKDIRKEIKKDNRVLITTLTKKSSEELCGFFQKKSFKITYMHSEIKALDRIRIIRDLRKGRVDILVGINLLREGLDLPEVSLVIILDADKTGFLRSKTAIIQTLGRASRNIAGRAILYVQKMSQSLDEAVQESMRRRDFQDTYNQKNNIIPSQVRKEISPFYDDSFTLNADKIHYLSKFNSSKELHLEIEHLTVEMKVLASQLEFKKAAQIRDHITELKNLLINEFWEE
jgi:excinuclease ABC subunit B